MSALYDLSIDPGATYRRGVRLKTDDVIETAASWVIVVEDRWGETVIEQDMPIADGWAQLHFTPDQTKLIGSEIAYYHVNATWDNGDVERVLEGRIT